MNNSFPFVTCYARILDRITLRPLTEFKDTLKQESIWDLGIIHSDAGGYSQYLIEFDIWNNEPDVSGGMTQQIFDDAENCKITIYTKFNQILNPKIPIFQIRNSLFEKQVFVDIADNDNFDIYGNVDKNKIGNLNGIGDHTMFQIGIKIPEGLNLINENIDFEVCFEYDAQNMFVSLPFYCTINLTNKIMELVTTNIGNPLGVLSGEIIDNTLKSQQTIIEAYDINNILKDQYIIRPKKIIRPTFDIYGFNEMQIEKFGVTNNTYDLDRKNIYSLFLQSGIYNFNIRNNLANRWINNSLINEGINSYYTEINSGLIYNSYDDVIEYLNNENTKEIHGYIINEYNELVPNAEIIITQKDKLIVYYITDINGQYKFKLDNGIYDIRLRSSNKRVKIFRDFNFDINKGFFTELQKLSSDFSKDFNFVCEY